MKCPNDKSELIGCLYEGDIEIGRCPKCQGVWLDVGELEKIQETVEKDYAEELRKISDYVGRAYEMAGAKQAAELDCKGCGRVLDRREYGYCSQVMIDVCPSCRGIWLDKGELEMLEVFFERARSEAKEIRKGFFGSLVSFFR